MTAPAVFLTQHYADAVQYAATIHANQTRKGNDIPYITHPLAVSSLVLEAGGDEEQAIAGLLHDAAEDCGGEGRLTDIKARFGARVEGIVRGCSDSLTEDPNKKAPWRTRKREHLAHLRVADDDTLLVSAADKLHNARALWTDLQLEGIDTLTRFNARPPNIQWFYEQMLAIFIAKAAPEVLTRPLSEVIDRMRPILNARGPAAVQLRREPTRGSGVERDAWILAIDELAVFPTERLTLGRDTDTVPAEIAEPRREASYGEWSTRACREILQLLPFASLEVVSCGGRWEMRVFQGAQSEMIVGFRSDGSWVEPTSPRVKRWSEVLEGGPEEVGRHVARPHARLRHGPDVGREGVTDAATVSGPGEEAL